MLTALFSCRQVMQAQVSSRANQVMKNKASGPSGESDKHEAHAVCLREASIAQLTQVIILQKCRTRIIKLPNFLEAENWYFYSKLPIVR